MRRLKALLATPSVRVVSVDIFDTLLLRGTRPELQRFGDVAAVQAAALREAGLAAPDASALYRARLQAHKRAYDAVRAAGRGEVTLAAVLEAVCRICDLPPEAVPVMARTEVACEKRALRLNRALAALLSAPPSPRRIVFASDMYLPGGAVRELVTHAAPAFAGHAIYVSADWGATKRRGDLYARIAAAEGVPPEAILHIGDNRLADVESALAAGVRAWHLPRRALWRAVHHARDRAVRRRLRRRGWLVDTAAGAAFYSSSRSETTAINN